MLGVGRVRMVEELGEKLEGKAEVVTCMVSRSTRGVVSRGIGAMFGPPPQCPRTFFGPLGAFSFVVGVPRST